MEQAGIPINLVDAAVIGITLLSGILALFRGFTREAMQVAGWAIAFTLTALLLPYAKPLALEITGSPVMATPAAAAVIFIGTLIVCSLISGQIAGAVRKSPLSVLDRSLGFGFGLARGGLLVCLIYIGLLLISEPKQVEKTVAKAKSGQLIQLGSDGLLSLLPEKTVAALDLKDDIELARPDLGAAPPPLDVVEAKAADHKKAAQVSQKEAESQTNVPQANAKPDKKKPAGYGNAERQTIDSLIEQSSKSE